MSKKIKQVFTYLAILGLAIQSSLFAGLINPQKAHAGGFTAGDPNKVLINEFLVYPAADSDGLEKVEIYNSNSTETEPIDISYWYIADAVGQRITAFDYPVEGTQLNPGEFYVFESTSSVLNNDTDEIYLWGYDWLNADGYEFNVNYPTEEIPATIDNVNYGPSPLTIVKAPTQGKSAGRLDDGAASWYTNLAASFGTNNEGASNQNANPEENWPTQINSVNIKAGTTNPADYINSVNQTNVTVEMELVNLPNSSLTAYISDNSANRDYKSASAEAQNGQFHQEVSGINASDLVDGEVTPWVTVTHGTSGITTEYMEGTTGLKNTTNPDAPTAASIQAGDNNPENVINSFNKTATSVNVTLPSSLGTHETLTVTLTDSQDHSVAKTISGTFAPTNNKDYGKAVVEHENVVVSGIDTSTLADGAITVQAQVTDTAGNPSDWFTGAAGTKDTINPTGGFFINNGATVTNSTLVNLSLSSADAAKMMIANEQNFTDSVWEDFSISRSWSLLTGSGDKTVYVKLMDAAGNIATLAAKSIILDQNTANIITNAVIIGEQTITPTPGIELTLTGLMNTVLTTATYNQNPGTSLPTGISAFGRNYEMALANPLAVSWPIMIKVYYTASDLAAAGVTDEQQLVGIYYWNNTTGTWELYTPTGVNTNDITVNGIDYAGYVWANADHLTPLTIGADISAPDTSSANFSATASDGEISLQWNKISDAVGYFLSYRELGSTNYTTVFISGANTTTAKVTGLENNTLYEFSLQAVDAHGNKSQMLTLTSSPVASKTAAESLLGSFIGKAQAAEITPEISQETEITTVGPDNGQVESSQTSSTTRAFVTLAIILIALGAGMGGYYGYDWWMKRDKVKSKAKKPSKKEPSGRW